MNASKPKKPDSNQRLTPRTTEDAASCRNSIERAKQRLDQLPNPRADVIFQALTKLKAGLYTTEAAITAAASKALEAPELQVVSISIP